MGESCNGITSVMTEGYDYITIFRCVNCGKESIQDYKEGVEYNKCPHCKYSIGIHEKPVEKTTKQTTFEGFK
jgi:DNA-directed RNA polymerase subunit RPC12/RpoP